MAAPTLFSRRWISVLSLLVVLSCLFTPAGRSHDPDVPLVVQLLIASTVTVKHENFKTCDQSGFCRRNRQYADAATAASTSWVPPYQLDKAVNFKDGKLSGTVIKTLPGTNDKVRLPLTISFLKSGVARVSLDEERRQKKDIEL